MIALGFVAAVGLPLAVIVLAIFLPERRAEDVRPHPTLRGHPEGSYAPSIGPAPLRNIATDPQVKRGFDLQYGRSRR